jgi:hypothetical protein
MAKQSDYGLPAITLTDARGLSAAAQEDLLRPTIKAVLDGMTQTEPTQRFDGARPTSTRWESRSLAYR